MEAELDLELVKGGRHPLYSLALHRASKTALQKGEITQEKFDTIKSVIRNPIRKSEDGRTADILEEAKKHTVTMAAADESLPADIRTEVVGLNFDFGKIWEWIKTHLPQILQCIAALLSIFVLLV